MTLTKLQDDPQTMYDQVKRYQDEGYPSQRIDGMVILRRHNEKVVSELWKIVGQKLNTEVKETN